MTVVSLTISGDLSAGEIANLKKDYLNADGSTPSNAQLQVNMAAYWKARIMQRYREKRHNEQTAAISVTDLALS